YSPSVAAAAHAADVVDQRPGCDCGGRRNHTCRRAQDGCESQRFAGLSAGNYRDRRCDQQHRWRLHHYRPHAEDVQIQRAEKAMNNLISTETVIEVAYLIATALFILSLKWLSSPTTARRGVFAGEAGMVLAIAGTLLHHGIVDYKWIAIALVLGTVIGIPLGNVQMTAVPQRTALSHAFGALCVTLVGTAEFYLRAPNIAPFMMAVLSMEVIVGSLTFTGSLMAAGKLQEILPQRPITYKGQNFVNLALLACAVGIAAILMVHPEQTKLFPAMIIIPLIFGVML